MSRMIKDIPYSEVAVKHFEKLDIRFHTAFASELKYIFSFIPTTAHVKAK